MASGAHIFDVFQACIILSWYFYSEGRWVEVWIFSGFMSRVAVPLRLNHKGTFSSRGAGSPGAYLAPPKDPHELEMRRRTWWMCIVLDRVVSVGGWLHGIEYKHIATELPLRRIDFESDVRAFFYPITLANHYHLYSWTFLAIRRTSTWNTSTLHTLQTIPIRFCFSSRPSCSLALSLT